MSGLVMNRTIPSKEDLTKEAEKYAEADSSIAYIKGVRRGIKLCLAFVQDSFRSKIEKLIK